MAEPFDEFMDDVAKDMRQEQLEKFWKQYGRLILWTCAGIVGLSAIWTINSNRSSENLRIVSEKFTKAQRIASQDAKKALGVYETITDSDSKTYSALSRIASARILSSKGGADFQKAQSILMGIYDNKNLDDIFRDFARLTYIKNEIDTFAISNLEQEVTSDIKVKLENLIPLIDTIATDISPWRLSALDIKGLIFILLHEYQKAADVYVVIAQNTNCPEGLQKRADLMLQYALKKLN